MGLRLRFVWLIGLFILAACGSPSSNNEGPRLVMDVTLEPTMPAPTRFLSPTPERTVIALTSEVLSPLQNVTLDADFVLVTPTLPPSKTPTHTPTITTTPTQSPTPSITVTATATMPAFPTSIIQPITAVVAAPIQQICDSTWFFIEPRPANCPLAPPTVTQGVFQPFQNGYMIWLQSQDAIYVMYNNAVQPRWEVYRDHFDEGMAEDEPSFGEPPAPGLWRPRRGFGLLWRSNSAVRDRIGWAIEQWEKPYSAQVQSAGDGSFFVNDATGSVFAIFPNGVEWARYAGFTGFN